MNSHEREPVESQELRGRLEEHHKLVAFTTQDFNTKGGSVEERLGEIGDEMLGEKFAGLVESTVKFVTFTETTNWVLALRQSGVSDQDVLRIWDQKTQMDEERAERENTDTA